MVPTTTTAATRPSFEMMAELVLQADDHPEVRLATLTEARRALQTRTAALREAAADRVERWRYQLLNHWSGRLPEVHDRLARGLDALFHELRGGVDLPARDLRAALAAAREAPLPDGLAMALDPAVPIERVEAAARAATLRHFHAAESEPGGTARRSMVLYAPLYLANHCINHCLYCGFRFSNPMERVQLDESQARAEAQVLRDRGFRHILLVAGEFPRYVSVDYLAGITSELARRGFSIALEVAPQSTLAYATLRAAGAAGVTLYQETYDEALYARYHPKGTKAWYDWRLEGPERAAEAGMARLGLGILLGLADPEDDLRALIAHGRYLLDRFPALRLAFSLPRIHEAPDGFEPPVPVDDATFVRLYCALRLAFPAAHLVLSTREAPALRDRLAEVCITQMSAGSSTAPGGYRAGDSPADDRQQFPVCDPRGPAEVAGRLAARGFAVRWDHEPPGLL